MDINDSYLSFIFDEACEYILSMKTFKEVKRDGNIYKQECWIKEPQWNDIAKEKIKISNNIDLVKEMQENLKKYK